MIATARARVRNVFYRGLHLVSGPGRGVRVILLYHSIGTNTPMALAAEDLERQLGYLARTFRVMTLSEFVDWPHNGENIAAITFDDGYADNYELALPILQRLNLRATFFIAAGFLGHEIPTSWGPLPMMSEVHVRQLVKLGHEVGAHTLTHPRLTELPLAAARQEIGTSKHCLEQLCGREVGSFAYPKGRYNRAVRRLVADAGFRCAVTTRRGLVERHSDRLALPRVAAGRQMSPAAFSALLSPVTRWLARIRP